MTGNGTNCQSDATIDFAVHFATSDQFKTVFKEGMGLVEETANYLDGPGRKEARGLDRHGSIAYATESMRLTTRLMQLASWLLLQRALHAGELTQEEAVSEKHRINLSDIGSGQTLQGGETLPESLENADRAKPAIASQNPETRSCAERQRAGECGQSRQQPDEFPRCSLRRQARGKSGQG